MGEELAASHLLAVTVWGRCGCRSMHQWKSASLKLAAAIDNQLKECRKLRESDALVNVCHCVCVRVCVCVCVCVSVVLSFCHSVILSFWHSGILSFCHSVCVPLSVPLYLYLPPPPPPCFSPVSPTSLSATGTPQPPSCAAPHLQICVDTTIGKAGAYLYSPHPALTLPPSFLQDHRSFVDCMRSNVRALHLAVCGRLLEPARQDLASTIAREQASLSDGVLTAQDPDTAIETRTVELETTLSTIRGLDPETRAVVPGDIMQLQRLADSLQAELMVDCLDKKMRLDRLMGLSTTTLDGATPPATATAVAAAFSGMTAREGASRGAGAAAGAGAATPPTATEAVGPAGQPTVGTGLLVKLVAAFHHLHELVTSRVMDDGISDADVRERLKLEVARLKEEVELHKNRASTLQHRVDTLLVDGSNTQALSHQSITLDKSLMRVRHLQAEVSALTTEQARLVATNTRLSEANDALRMECLELRDIVRCFCCCCCCCHCCRCRCCRSCRCLWFACLTKTGTCSCANASTSTAQNSSRTKKTWPLLAKPLKNCSCLCNCSTPCTKNCWWTWKMNGLRL